MVKQRIVIYSGDSTNTGIVILDHQPDGVYRYYPSEEDEIKLVLYNEDKSFSEEFIADTSNPENVFVDIDTTDYISGTYLYDVIINIEGNVHHIAVGQEIYVIGGKRNEKY